MSPPVDKAVEKRGEVPWYNIAMGKITLALKSRTFWTLVLTWLVVHGPIISQLLPLSWKPMIDGALVLIATYFHVNPSQNYTQ